MRKPLVVMAVAVMAAIGFTAPAQASVNAVDKPFGMAYGNSTTSGTIHFTDGRSASVSGTVHAASGGRYACTYGVNGNTESDHYCSETAYANGTNNVPLIATLTIPVTGGVQRVYVTMYNEYYEPVSRLFCTRIGCTRVY